MATSTDNRRHAPATLRNRGPILEVLSRVLPGADGAGAARTRADGTKAGWVLEVASGTGEHAAWLAPRLHPFVWQPSDADPAMLASIEAHLAAVERPNLRRPLALDVTDPDWPRAVQATLGDAALAAAALLAIVNINMIHIAPWRAAEGLMAGVGRLLPAGGLLYLYGPFRIAGKHTAPSNEAFDRSLRARNPEWGVRDLDAVTALASAHGLTLRERVAMPANNLSVIFART